jgi:hypothetical protein
MYCPSCGCEQVNNNVQFCYRCRFQLGGVTDLLNNQGMPPYRMQQPPPVIMPPHQLQQPPMMVPPPISKRKKGMKNGAKLIFLSGALLPIFILFCGIADHPAPLIVPFTVFLAGLYWLLYARIFVDDYPIPQAPQYPQQYMANQPPQFMANPPRSALPDADSYRVNMPPQRVNTSEIVDPPSVTEHTTHFLNKE